MPYRFACQHAVSGCPKGCHTLAHSVLWVYERAATNWLKACHILAHGMPCDTKRVLQRRVNEVFAPHGEPWVCDVTGFQPVFKTHDVNPRHAVGYYVAALRAARCGMLTRETLRHGETLMPFRQIVNAGRVRRVSPYAITFMPFRQFKCVICKSQTRHLCIANTSFMHRKHVIYASQTRHLCIANTSFAHCKHGIYAS